MLKAPPWARLIRISQRQRGLGSIVSPSDSKPKFYCDVCDLAFSQGVYLQSHVGSRRHKLATQENGKKTAGQQYLLPRRYTGQSLDHENSAEVQNERARALQDLKACVHTLDELVEFGYVVRPYTRMDIRQQVPCKFCGLTRRFLLRRTPRTGMEIGTLYALFNCRGRRGKPHSSQRHFFPTPSPAFIEIHGRHMPIPYPSQLTHRAAIALDCDIAHLAERSNEVLRLCAVDYITGETLIDKVVQPSNNMLQINWYFRQRVLRPAVDNGEALESWKEAREELWKFMGPNTVLVGHGLHNDLRSLGIIHTRIVDSWILLANMTGAGSSGVPSLKKLCKRLLDWSIQIWGRKTHSCREDAMAVRELVLRMTDANNKEVLGEWVRGEGRKPEQIRPERRPPKRKIYSQLRHR